MNEASESAMILATACPHCGTECEFELPPEAKTDAALASQIRIVCHSCNDMFQPVGDDIASDADEMSADATPSDLSSAENLGTENQDAENQDAENKSKTEADDVGLGDFNWPDRTSNSKRNTEDTRIIRPAPAKRGSAGIIFLSLSILLLAAAITGAGYWLANSSNPAIRAFVETQVLQIEPARFEASRAQFERKQTEMGETLQILVEISNLGGQPATPTDVTLQLLDANGAVAFSWIMDTSKTVIDPGNTANYLARMIAPPAEISDIRVLIPNKE